MTFDLVVQGPLDRTSIENIDSISKQFENIVISYWSENDEGLLDDIKSDNVSLVHHPTPDLNKTIGVMKDSTFFYSIFSTYNGIMNCKSQYVIKMRSDESYENFDPLKSLFLKNDSKFVFGNIFAKPWSDSHYHIGDHLFACERLKLQKSYETLYNIYTNKLDINQNLWATQGDPSHQTAESILAKSFLKAKSIPEETWEKRKTFLDNFNVIDIEKLGKYQASWNHGNETYNSDGNRFDWPVKVIGEML
jgi:hypothetical protein